MDIKIKHFTKLVVLAAILAVLWFFHARNKTFSTVLVGSETESRKILSSVASGDIDNVDNLGNVYRQIKSPDLITRRVLRSTENEVYSFQGRQLLSENLTGHSLADDDTDADCSDVHKVPTSDRCAFVNSTDDCQIDEGFLDYTYFVYCDFSSNLLPLGVVILVIWWLFLFVGLAVTADDFFCPSLAVISDTMRLTFGNGAPDIFSAIAAIGNAKDGDAGLAIGALFGAGVFVTTVVAGFIVVICPFDAMQRPFLRDIIFYLAALFWTFYILWDKKITKVEAIGFILLYVVYVLVVVIGRYIYTRQRRDDPPESRNERSIRPSKPAPVEHPEPTGITSDIQEPSGREVVNPLDTVTDGEDQPLLSNPDVISLTAVNNDSPFKEFLHHMNPIDQNGWSGFSLFKKFYEIFKSPIMFCLKITIPVVNYEEEKNNWNRHLYCIQCVLGPLFGVAATKVGFSKLGGSFPVWVLVLILGIMLAALVYFTSKNDTQPKYHSAFAYLGFVIAVVWIYSVANEIVNILQTFGVVMKISNAILGLTLLAWGNSIGDFIADTVMARQGFPRMGISACFGGPLFNLLLGIGIPFTIATVKQGDYSIQITLEEIVLAAFLCLSLVSSLLIVPLSKFKMTRGWGIYLVVLYMVFLVIAILTETGVIHADIDNNS
ncbi:Mitochondrial sodium/calcium exchanger protein [Mactra antiquata]